MAECGDYSSPQSGRGVDVSGILSTKPLASALCTGVSLNTTLEDSARPQGIKFECLRSAEDLSVFGSSQIRSASTVCPEAEASNRH